jgi:polyvinyl alcohol dehydrogenase (cytochrome)
MKRTRARGAFAATVLLGLLACADTPQPEPASVAAPAAGTQPPAPAAARDRRGEGVAPDPALAEIYTTRCGICHDNGVERAPTRAALGQMSPEDIVAALTNGLMREQSAGLNREQVRGLAEQLTGRRFGGAQAVDVKRNPCTQAPPALALTGAQWNGWGRDLENTRFQPEPGLAASDVPKLKLKWAYAYPGRSAYGQPSIAAGRLFATSTTGRVNALDAQTGCEHWTYEAGAGVRTAVVIGEFADGARPRFVAFLGDQRANAHAIDAETGALLWKIKLDEHRAARITGSPVVHAGRVYFPISSGEEGAAGDPAYPCCTFRGAVAALDARTGQVIWKAHAIQDEPKPFKTSTAGTQMSGPAGAAIWSSPTIDAKRRLVYAATGNSYTDVDTDGADAIVAFDLETGQRRWVRQVTPNDNFVLRCGGADRAGKNNCPEDGGPDYDFGSPPMLKSLPGGKQILIASQKSGTVYGLDPDNDGALLWQTQVGGGSALGGVQWGPAADAERVYVAISDASRREGPRPGLSALDPATGKVIWSTPTPPAACSWTGAQRCARGQSAAVTAIPGIVLSGAVDGHMRAYSARDGAIVWDVDTAPALDTVNGVRVEGGGLDGGGPTIANGILYVNSGGGGISARGGRLLLAFTVDGK